MGGCELCRGDRPCDAHCSGCGRDLFSDDTESYQITRWDPEKREWELVAVLCPDCMPRF